MSTIVIVYVWAFIVTALILLREAALARRLLPEPVPWDYLTIGIVLALSVVPPIGLFVSYLIYRRRLHTTQAMAWERGEEE